MEKTVHARYFEIWRKVFFFSPSNRRLHMSCLVCIVREKPTKQLQPRHETLPERPLDLSIPHTIVRGRIDDGTLVFVRRQSPLTGGVPLVSDERGFSNPLKTVVSKPTNKLDVWRL